MSEYDSLEGATDAPPVPPIPSQRDEHETPAVYEAREHFDTPSWLGPSRRGAEAPSIPAQGSPGHDTYTPPPPPKPTRDIAILGEGHWTERARPRVFAGTLLVLSLLGVVACLVLTITTQSVGAIAGLAACAIVAVIFRGALMSASVTTVELKGATLKVRRDGQVDTFNLADPTHLVEMTGDPRSSSWRLTLEALGARYVELTSANVDAAELAPVVTYYREVAARELRDRERRYNR
ncbi:MAG: hypothetical protein J7518_02030 [Nocardioidaceae bacterium]|nr:hypothetical protein [Nocardioidaceae bacterium]